MKQQTILQFTMKDKRLLRENLEKMYAMELYNWNAFKRRYTGRKTSYSQIDREFRMHLKAMELLLFRLQSNLFENVKRPSIRQTLTIDERHNWPVHG